MRIGKRLQELRKEKDITLKDLSKKTGVALATLSRMENNKMPGTVASHTKICKALGVSIAELYSELEEKTKVIEAKLKPKYIECYPRSSKVRYELLVTKPNDKKIMPLIIKFAPGGKTQTLKTKLGIEKFVYVTAGVIEAAIGDEKYTLKHGDSLYFDSSLPHTFTNASPKEAEIICVISPPA